MHVASIKHTVDIWTLTATRPNHKLVVTSFHDINAKNKHAK